MADRGSSCQGRDEAESIRNLKIVSSNGDAEAKIPEEKATEDEFSDLLTQPAEILEKIINFLDPNSLRELALSCKDLYHFCRHSKGIHVVFPTEQAYILKNMEDNGCFTGPIIYVYNCHRKTGNFEEYLAMLRKWNFAIHIRFLDIDRGVGGNDVRLAIKDLIMRSGIKKIHHIRFIPKTVEDAGILADFVKIFGIESVMIVSRIDPLRMPADIVEACVKLPVNELWMPSIRGNLNADVLRDSSISRLHSRLLITLAGTEEIMQIWKYRNGLESWVFRGSPADSDQFYDIFNGYDVLPFGYSGPIDRSRPLAFKKVDYSFRDTTTSFYILREDGEVFFVSHILYSWSHVDIRFGMCPIDQLPPALREH